MGLLDAPGIPPTKAGAEQIATLRATTMRPWWAALADCDNNPADVLLVDDSTGEGTATTSATFYPSNRWASRILGALRSAFMTTPTGGPGYIPAWYAISPAISGVGPTISGAPTLTNSFSGLGARSMKFTAAGQSAVYTVSGLTSVDLMVTKGSGSGIISYSIDGGVATQINAFNASTLYGQKVRVAIPDTGSHTITIAYVSGGGTWFEGFMAYNGDETKGIRLWDSAHHGVNTGQFSGDDTSGSYSASHQWANSIPSTTKLIVIGTGLNDYGNNIGSTLYKTRMTNLIAVVRAMVPAPVPIVLLGKYQRTDANGITAEASDAWANYIAKLYQLAAADTSLWVIDLTKRMTKVSSDTLGLYAGDNTHINNLGHNFVRQAIQRQISPLSGA